MNGNYGGPKVRDRLCQLIRQHQLDAHLVKSYAVDFCGAKALLDATREQVEGFVAHLADWAEKDRDALLCQLNSYPACQGGRMTRRFQGLNQTVQPAPGELPDGLYLVRVEKAQYRWHAHKPFYVLRLSVLEPQEFAGQTLSGQLYCAAKALWKLGWFLRDFAYDADLLGRDEVDEKALSGLRGIVKISHAVVGGASSVNFEGFAPASQWEELSSSPVSLAPGRLGLKNCRSCEVQPRRRRT